MSNLPAVWQGVTQAIDETGEPLTITRTTQIPGDGPTQPGTTVTDTYTALGYVGPMSQWNADSQQREVTTECYIDPLSLRDDAGDLVNTTSALTIVTREGDVVSDTAGNEWRLTREQHPRLEGRVVLFWHRGLA